jgi:7-cyano-7-deazaguanine synthase in queuosine biosynthesis
MYASLLTSYAIEYAYYLDYVQNLNIRTIFCAAIESDAVQMAHHSFTALRVIMFNICCQTHDFSWQFTSPLIEKEIGLYLGKEDVIRWASDRGLPIHRTWSCYHKGLYHCGSCVGCGVRREAFRLAGAADHTVYTSNFTFGVLKGKIKARLPQAVRYWLDQWKS